MSKIYAIKNSDLEKLMNYFDFTFLPYVYKSRTILLSRVIRIVEKKDEEELNNLLEKMKNYIEQFEKENSNNTMDVSDSKNEEVEKKKRKKKNIFDDIFNQLG
ncbi:hypothetical protein RU93_GL000075 [Enterococcus aquimarinus]|uniref:Uncharacterized protein n=1 Tax=Enterococcus aquimarinus TaxID=328396 RepID=A0A1L8QXD3_9ENTE|nr:hypothetical protein RU93_GL000075 [Enterococcus aquimarinus]